MSMKFRSILYKKIHKYLFNDNFNNKYFLYIKWKLGMALVGAEFHEYNLKFNKKKLSKFFDNDMLLQEDMTILLEESDCKYPKILDVGAGPITKVGKIYKGEEVEIIAIDPQAEKYTEILKENNLHPPVVTQPGYGEELSKIFEANTFDLIHARNSIDHSATPLKIIYEMIKVLKNGRYIYLNHFINEGERASYYGLHQWNFYKEDDCFYISNRGSSVIINVTDKLKHSAHVNTIVKNDRIIVTIKTIK